MDLREASGHDPGMPARALLVLAALACSWETAAARAPAPAHMRADASPPAPQPAASMSLENALAALRARGFGDAADTIARRAAQRAPKMRLDAGAARRTATAVLAVADRDAFVALHRVLPRSTVELARAIAERDLDLAEAEAIATYLVRVVAALRFERLSTFDENHSHVTGRDWHQIDYSGEAMTWQGQRDHWVPRGVGSFKRAADIHAYFVGAERLPHWRRVYRPRGRMSIVAPPWSSAARGVSAPAGTTGTARPKT
jgi:hypothetical protein